MSGVRILGALRLPVAPRGGALSRHEIHQLGAPLLRRLLDDAGLPPEAVDEVVVGNALGGGGNPARLAALAAGLPQRVAGLSIDRQCCGGLDALILGAALIGAGGAEAVLAGGIESYSRRPLRLRTDPGGGPPVAYDRPPFTPWPDRDPGMDAAAAALAAEAGIARAAQDAWAIDSHRKARAARMHDEILPLAGLDRDAFTRALSPTLAARAPVLCGPITAANAAVAADGAAFCLMVSDRLAARLGARLGAGPGGVVWRGGATLGDRPEMPGLAPVAAIGAVLDRAGLRADRLAVAEVMEAYAVQALACIAGAGLDPAIVNPGGGGLARGHPVGASGAINAVRLFHELRRRGGTGIAAIAAAGGLGSAVAMALS
ncbi:acetyl-CoA C-acyltransferase [Paracoccus spongiarum]|uniref:Acetyl-CoA C-acyltransferase n=1 Tax=Paracoccus spongiarum TaxID=3064387 RepID=A0ABT9J9S0_9RHOB|nr:acetyl-CoA C-acyltransferase [Paracoccus sp. 2205BS29-5]MDP5306552.1 acetyl-CoA C-acyltransferase [Paracoccus sp. 2205BS29-5]